MPEHNHYPPEISITNNGELHIHYHVNQESNESEVHEHRVDLVQGSSVQSPPGQGNRSINKELKNQYMEMILESMDISKDHYLITWTYGKKEWGWKWDEVAEDVKQIRKRIIQLFYPNFKLSNQGKRPTDFPGMWFFIEPHKDDQYHIHLLMEGLSPDLKLKGFHRDGFNTKWNRVVRQRINKRNQRVISNKMIENYNGYSNHPYANKTFDQIGRFDDWLWARFLCDYISHFNKRNGETWGLSKISNKTDKNHSKVIDSSDEVIQKIDYLNKDKNFKFKSGEGLSLDHLCLSYSDLTP